MATLLPSITTGLKPVFGSLSGPVLALLGPGLGLQPLGTSLGLLGTLVLRVWQVLMSSSRMSLVWASWCRLSSTLRMSVWAYPNLRKRSTLACCWRSIAPSCCLSQVCLSLGIPRITSLFWPTPVSKATACVLEQLTGVKDCGCRQRSSVTENTGSTSVASTGFSDNQIVVACAEIESALVAAASWLWTQAPKPADVTLSEESPSRPERGSKGVRCELWSNFTSWLTENSHQKHEWMETAWMDGEAFKPPVLSSRPGNSLRLPPRAAPHCWVTQPAAFSFPAPETTRPHLKTQTRMSYLKSDLKGVPLRETAREQQMTVILWSFQSLSSLVDKQGSLTSKEWGKSSSQTLQTAV